MNENFCIFIRISPKFIPKGLIDNNPGLVCRIGGMPLSEPMLTWLNDAQGGDELRVNTQWKHGIVPTTDGILSDGPLPSGITGHNHHCVACANT